MGQESLARARYAVISTLLPSLSRADEVIRRAAMEHEATLAVIALTAYRNEAGRYPEQLADLVPTYLPKASEDIYDGQPLKYRLNGDGEPVLYSIWADFVDDGGTPIKKPPNNASVWPGDWIYLPAGRN